MKKKLFILVVITVVSIAVIGYLMLKDILIINRIYNKVKNQNMNEYVVETFCNGEFQSVKYYKNKISKIYFGEDRNIIQLNDYLENKSYYYSLNGIDLTISELSNYDMYDIFVNIYKNVTFKDRFKYIGIEKINGRDCYNIQLIYENENKVNVYIDKEYLITIRTVSIIKMENANNKQIIYDFKLLNKVVEDINIEKPEIEKYNVIY